MQLLLANNKQDWEKKNAKEKINIALELFLSNN